MKIENFLYYIAFITLLSTSIYAHPTVTNVAFSISGTTVTVNYDVAATTGTVTISMNVSSDNGTTWNFNYGTASGDIGIISLSVRTKR